MTMKQRVSLLTFVSVGVAKVFCIPLNGGWRLVVDEVWGLTVGSWRRLAAVGGRWRLAVGGPRGLSLRGVLRGRPCTAHYF